MDSRTLFLHLFSIVRVHEKDRKKQEKNQKKVLTKGRWRDIIVERSSEGAGRVRSGGRGNLENDTVEEEKTTVNSEMSFNL